jgi:hypothetical protein
MNNMAEKISTPSMSRSRSNTPKKIIRVAPAKQERNILWQGLLLYFIAILVVTFGVLGFLTYDEYVEPNLSIFICCIPSIIVAIILIFFGFSTRMNVVRAVRQPDVMVKRVQMQDTREDVVDISGKRVNINAPVKNKEMKKYQVPKFSQKDLIQKKNNLSDFIKNLDEQHKSGLLFDETYLELKTKYQLELNDINNKLKTFNKDEPKFKK